MQAFSSIPDWVIGCGLLVVLLLANELGFRIGSRVRSQRKDGAAASGDLGAIQGAVLGILGLLLAFTYSFASTRHNTRKELLVREANAIHTAHLRAGLLPEPRRSELQAILVRYVDSRLVNPEVAHDQAKLTEAVRRSEQVLAALWPAASRDITSRAPNIIDSIVFQGLNTVIDLHTERMAAFNYRIPGVILWLLLVVAGMAMALTGFSGGSGGRRNLFFTTTLALLVTAVLIVILDLDHPVSGLIRVDQQSMIQLRDNLHANPVATPNSGGQ